MPVYRYWCAGCGESTEVWRVMEDRRLPVGCKGCGRKAELAPPSRVSVNLNQVDFVSADVTGEPVRYQTKRQFDEACARNGVVRLGSDELPSKRRRKSKGEQLTEVLSGMPSMREDMARVGHETGLNDVISRQEGEVRRKGKKGERKRVGK